VGSYAGGGRGQVAAISPDGTVTVLWGPTSAFTNINSLIFDSTHRLLFIDADVKRVFASSGGFPSALFNLANSPASIAVDAIDHIYTSDITGTIAVHAADGSLINSALATGLGTWPVLLRGPCGSAWEDVLYAINYDTGDFIRIDTNGVQTTIGSGFQGASWATFGPDCALYVTVPGKILRIPLRSSLHYHSRNSCRLATMTICLWAMEKITRTFRRYGFGASDIEARPSRNTGTRQFPIPMESRWIALAPSRESPVPYWLERMRVMEAGRSRRSTLMKRFQFFGRRRRCLGIPTRFSLIPPIDS
jgi:hypothetical protein